MKEAEIYGFLEGLIVGYSLGARNTNKEEVALWALQIIKSKYGKIPSYAEDLRKVLNRMKI